MDSNQIINAIHALNASLALLYKEQMLEEAEVVLKKLLKLIDQV